MKILIPDIIVPGNYVSELVYALQNLGHEVVLGDDNFFHSRWQPDVIASQWPEGYFRTLDRISRLKSQDVEDLRQRLEDWRQKAVILSFIHNTKARASGDRQRDSILKELFQTSYGAAHGFVHFGKVSVSEVEKIYPAQVYRDKPTLVVSHGLFEQLRIGLPELDKHSGQKSSSPGFKIFVPGAIRNWSEFSFVIQGFLKANIPGKQLIIAGDSLLLKGRHPLKRLRATAIRSVPGVSLYGRRLSNEELCRETMSANVVLSPRLWATNSGIPYLAATFQKRCIAPAVGNLSEALRELNGIHFDPSHPASLAKALEAAHQEQDLVLLPDLPCPSWQEIARQIEAFVVQLKQG